MFIFMFVFGTTMKNDKISINNLRQNIKHLRTERKLSQEAMADILSISRGQYCKYELGTCQPSLEILSGISSYYHITLDLLVKADLSKSSYQEILSMKDNRLLLPITVQDGKDDNIEIVPDKAKAGYQSGYADPEYIENLQRMRLPFLPSGKFRAFPIEGDSMLPIYDGSMIVGKYVEDLESIQDGKTYIIVSLNDGIVYKRVFKQDDGLMLVSDNKAYKPYTIEYSEILEKT